MIAQLPTLKYLDDRPVFDEDRLFAEAFQRGGFEEERNERDRFKKEKDEKHWKNHEAFQEMIKQAREEKRLADLAKAAGLAIEAPQPPASEEVAETNVEVPQEEVEVKEEEKVEEAANDEEPPELEEVDMEQERLILLTK